MIMWYSRNLEANSNENNFDKNSRLDSLMTHAKNSHGGAGEQFQNSINFNGTFSTVCSRCLKPILPHSGILCTDCERKVKIYEYLNSNGYLNIHKITSKFKISAKGFAKCPICHRFCAVNGNLFKVIECKHCGIIFKQFSDNVTVQFTDTNEDLSHFTTDYFDQARGVNPYESELEKQQRELKELWKKLNL